MPNSLTNSLSDFAASSGVTAKHDGISPHPTHEGMEEGHTSAGVPVLVEADALCHARAHEAGMHDADGDAAVGEVEAEQLADHVEGGLAGVVAVGAAALLCVAQGDAAALAADEDDARAGAGGDDARLDQRLHDEDGPDGRRLVHGHLVGEGGLVERLEVEVARVDVQRRDARGGNRLCERGAGGLGADVDVGDPGDGGVEGAAGVSGDAIKNCESSALNIPQD